MSTRSTLSAAAICAAFLLASCGGSSGDSSGDDSDSASETPATEAIDSDGGDTSSDDDSEAAAGSNEEAEGENDLGIDLDELEESIGDFSTGEGGGAVIIDGASYEFEGEICIFFEDEITIEGPGETADGDPFWGAINIGETLREDLAGAGIDEATLDTFFGDKESAIDASVEVEIGRTELFGSGPDDQPDYNASIVLDNPLEGEITYAAAGTSVTGSGLMVDGNYVVLEFGETVEFEFTGSCS
jgi:hypothetical protein